MADESRSYGTFGGGPSHDYLFDILKRERKLEGEKELASHQAELDMKRQEKAHEFTTIIEGMRNQGAMERQAQAFQMQDQQELQRGQGVLDYVGQRAVQEAQGGNMIDALVERTPGEMEMGAATGTPSFTPKTINPRAAAVAQEDLFKGIDARRRTDEALRLKEQDRLINGIDENDVRTAQGMLPAVKAAGLDMIGSVLENAKPGTMSKTEFYNHVSKAQLEVQKLNMALERAKIYSEARRYAAEQANQSRKYAADAAARKSAGREDLSRTRVEIQKMNSLLNTSKSRIQYLQNYLNNLSISQVDRAYYQQQLDEETSQFENLSNIQGNLMQLETQQGLSPLPASRETVSKFNQALRESLDAIGYKGKNAKDVKERDLEKLDAEMAKRGYATKGEK